jgi:hypothetical protein
MSEAQLRSMFDRASHFCEAHSAKHRELKVVK